MEELAGSLFGGISNTLRKKRTLRSRPTETQSFITTQEKSLSPLASPFDETTIPICNGNEGATINSLHQRRSRNPDRRMQDGSQCVNFENKASQNGVIARVSHQNIQGASNSKDHMNGFLIKSVTGNDHKINADAQSISVHPGIENEKKPRRFKLKVDGVKRSIQGHTSPRDKLIGECVTDDISLKGIQTDQKVKSTSSSLVLFSHTYISR